MVLNGANGLKTRTSTNARSDLPPHNSFITILSLAPSCVLAVDNENSSGETGCNSGSVAPCEQTSVSNLAVRSLILLCLMEGNPPLGKTEHDQLRRMIHRHNEWVCEVEANHMGRVVSQLEAPFSVARFTAS